MIPQQPLLVPLRRHVGAKGPDPGGRVRAQVRTAAGTFDPVALVVVLVVVVFFFLPGSSGDSMAAAAADADDGK